MEHRGGDTGLPARLAEAMDKGRRVLWATQQANGAWDERSNIGPTSTTAVIVALEHAGLLPAEDLTEGARWLRARQRADGGFLAYPFATESDLGTTAHAWAALHLAPGPENAIAAERAKAFVRDHGGEDALFDRFETGDLAVVYLALAGLLDPKKLPSFPIAWALSDFAVDQLAKRFHFGIVMGSLQIPLIAERLKRGRGVLGKLGLGTLARLRGPLERVEHRRAIELFATYQNPDGSWNSNTVQTAIMVPALLGAGLSPRDDRVRRAATWLLSRRVRDPDGTWFDVFASDVWSTAFNLRALLESGVPPTDRRVIDALEWTLSLQLDAPQPKYNNRKKGAVRTGGWPFQTGNLTMADTDDTGVVLSAFADALEPGPNGERLPDGLARRIGASVDRARAWLKDMQNPDGGWAAFVWSLPAERPIGPMFQQPVRLPLDDPKAMLGLLRKPPPELGNPSTEDLTARVLHGLAAHGADTTYPEVDRAIRFLREQQLPFGGWWARWLCNYLASTSFVLSALAEAREDLGEVYVKRAIDWVLSRQNPDGGWGESTASYRDPDKAGIGPSSAPLTSLVVVALVDVGRGESDAVRRAIDYLFSMQRPDGSWPNGDFLLTNIPPDSFYFYSGNAKHLPLWALARYANRHAEAALGPAEVHGRWTSAVLEPYRQKTDPPADEVVREIYESSDLETINRMLRTILEHDDRIPPGLPARARAFFDETDDLPAWADPQQMKRAQEIFAEFGVYVTYGLFASSLPQAYASANGAEVLVQTGSMLRRVRQRIFETAQFLFDVLDEGAMDKDGRGIRAAQRVRLMHAAIRHLIRTRAGAPWDAATLGQPINQEDLAGTLMTFSSITFDALERFGLTLTEADANAWIHHWAVIGHYLGIERELLPRDIHDARQLTEAIRQRHWATSPQGRQLMAALLDMMQEFFTRDAEALDGLIPSVVRFLAGDQCADILGVPPSDWTEQLVHVFADVSDAIDQPFGEELVQQGLGRLAVGAMKWITEVERDHKQASFRIPKSLEQAVVPGT